ncbi:MAG: molecular chaperone DnaJ [Brachybacterium sp.]|nr:molecular chaperone DnaJ [Brachybacterium sp.]
MNEDYYDLLGVSREASTEEIKRAYRKLARTLHPDVNPEPEAQEKYKKVTQAYEVLSNPEKRQRYDMGGGPGMGGAGFGGAGFDFSDIFDMFAGASGMRGGRNQGPVPRQRRGGDILHRTRIELRDVVFGTETTVTFRSAKLCDVCQGSCSAPGTSPTRCTVCNGSGHVQKVAQSLLGQMVTMAPCAACQGHGDIIRHPCQECSGHGRVRTDRELTVRIPSGLENGTRIQLRGEGEVGEAGGPSGDLYVEVEVAPSELYERDGDDLLTRVEVPMTAAALGTTVPLDTFDGERDLEIKAGAQPGETITLRGLGITALRSERRGDLRATLDVVVPKSLTEEQKDLLRQFSASRGEDKGRHGSSQREHAGMFSRLRDRLRDW